jgi:transcriptional regulator with XRE-family HTH domain
MPKLKRPELAAEARRRNLAQLSALGGEVKQGRLRRRLTQQELAGRADISRSAESRIERGFGGGHTLDTWQRLALALDRPLIVRIQRDPLDDVADAGHLAIQELVLRVGRQAGLKGSFELPTRSPEPWRSIDVGLRDDRRRILIVCECWNSIGDIGAAVRSTTRKIDEATNLAVALWGDVPRRTSGCWIVRDTRRNRQLVRRYPEIFRSRFPGSSTDWVRVLVDGGLPPEEPGLLWCDVGATRLFAWRHKPGSSRPATRIQG